jgi:uncharacterized protein (UPF0332 family)
MKEDIAEIVQKAERSLNTAFSIFQNNDFDFAVSRAYYSMFYMAEAVLLTKGLSFSKHSGVISGFNQYFVKMKIFDTKYSKMLDAVSKGREVADYDYSHIFSKEKAQELLNNAKEFLEITKKYLLELDKKQENKE